MFNLSGSELIFLVVIALVVLGPDKLPEAMRKAGKAYADFKRMTSGFQSEMKSVLDEPLRELRETAELAKNAASWDTNMFNPTIGSNAKSSGGPTDRTAAASAAAASVDPAVASAAAASDNPAAASTTNGSAPPVSPVTPKVPTSSLVDNSADGATSGTPAPTDATSRRLARQPASDVSLPTGQLADSSEPETASATPDAVVASAMMTGFGVSTSAPESTDTDEVSAE